MDIPLPDRFLEPFFRAYYYFQPPTRELLAGDIGATFAQDTFSEFIELDRVGDELPAIEFFLSKLSPTDIVYDVGANLGVYSVFIALLGSTAIAFEPIPAITESIEKNAALNGVQIDIVPYALSDRNGIVEMDQPTAFGSSSIVDSGDLQVQRARGDALIEQGEVQKPDVLKIDVEGHELEVLKGLEKMITNGTPGIFCELHERAEPSTVVEWLTERGYTVETVPQDGLQKIIYASR